jgi:hypothetical protein
MEQGSRDDLLSFRRQKHEKVAVSGKVITIRDQAPLHRRNMALPSGYAFEKFIESLNRRIFFWPGTLEKPISYGLRHFERYREEKPAILRISFQSLIDSNPRIEAHYCRYNSGSPRCSYGRKSPRGPNTFQPADEFEGRPDEVVEVTFNQPLTLPANTNISAYPTGPWKQLF